MRLFKGLQFDLATWSIPVACVLLGSGLGVSRALLASEMSAAPDHTVECLDASGHDEEVIACDEEIQRLLADLDGDGSVDGYDLVLFLAEYGMSGPMAADLNDDGAVDSTDLTALLSQFNS